MEKENTRENNDQENKIFSLLSKKGRAYLTRTAEINGDVIRVKPKVKGVMMNSSSKATEEYDKFLLPFSGYYFTCAALTIFKHQFCFFLSRSFVANLQFLP